jgi:hypothetical protein
MAEKLNIAAMRTEFGAENEIKYSVHAGCSMCPCSPGYRVRKASAALIKQYGNCDVWVKVEVDVTELKKLMPKFRAMLNEEIAKQNGLALIA